MVKKKKTASPDKSCSVTTSADEPKTDSIGETSGESGEHTASAANAAKTPPFKCRQFMANRGSVSSSKKSRLWKNLKQIIASDKTPSTLVSYASLDASLSTKPTKKYSDLSGLPAKYKDPVTNLLYFNSDEFAQIRMSSQDIINGYLELRKPNA